MKHFLDTRWQGNDACILTVSSRIWLAVMPLQKIIIISNNEALCPRGLGN